MNKKLLIALFIGGLIGAFWLISLVIGGGNKTTDSNATKTASAPTISNNQTESKISIPNINTLDFLNDKDIQYINEYLLSVISDPAIKNSQKGNFEGVVRTASTNITDNQDRTDFSFIVDFKSLKKSWGVTVTRYKDATNSVSDIGFNCLPAEQLIYGDFKCQLYSQDSL